MLYKPPMQIQLRPYNASLMRQRTFFLAGTIDMGGSVDWQKETVERIEAIEPASDIYNPRRDDWNSSWVQTSEDPQFYQQVNWELDALDKADIIIMNFLATSKSPITLLELGLYASSGKLIVCCPDEFWRSGNVNIVCNNYCVPVYKTMDDLLKSLNL